MRARVLGVLGLLLSAALLSGCSIGLGTAGGKIPTGTLAGPVKDVKSMKGASIGVGSKNFTEEILLGKMTAIMLKSAGAQVKDLTNIPGSNAARQAQLANQVQVMWEYTGTAWLTYLLHAKPIQDPHKQYVAVRDEDKKKNHLVWLKPTPMNDTYTFAVTQKVRKKFHINKLSDLKKVPIGERTFCVESEFTNRPDGLEGMLKAYGIPLGAAKGVPRKNLRTLQTGAIYTATAKGKTCNFGEVFTTDGRLIALNLTPLADDSSFFPKYNGSLVINQSVISKYPQIKDLFDPISAKLTNKTLLKLNAEVDVDGRDAADVAFEWLKKEGFLAGG
jgi:osmoprotectant transport system substrate-binding protein